MTKITDERIAELIAAHNGPFGFEIDTCEALRELQSLRSLLSPEMAEALAAGANALDECRAIELQMGVRSQDQAYKFAAALHSLAAALKDSHDL